MRFYKTAAALLLCALSVNAWAQQKQAKKAWLFAYFREPGNQGIYLALSRDGLHYTELNSGKPWVVPEKPGEVMRDVFLTRGPDGIYRMVWTWSWHGDSLGYASSPDLVHWSEQKEIPVMQNFPETGNVWAPETYWDAKKKQWLLIWSSAMKDDAHGYRIWSTMTPDFNSFSKPTVFFDPGYVTIDATIFQQSKHLYRLIFKDQTLDPLCYQERFATGPTLEGPWRNISAPINESWSEGPSAIRVGDRFVVFYDHYRPPRARYEAVATRDWKHWEDITAETSLPLHCKHGSFMQIDEATAERLMARQDSAAASR